MFVTIPYQLISHFFHIVMCSTFRALSKIINWESFHYSFAIVVYCLLIGAAFLVLPLNWLLHWLCRIIVFVFLGPWWVPALFIIMILLWHYWSAWYSFIDVYRMKLFDIFYVMPYYPQPNKETERIEPKVSNKNNLILDKVYVIKIRKKANWRIFVPPICF